MGFNSGFKSLTGIINFCARVLLLTPNIFYRRHAVFTKR